MNLTAYLELCKPKIVLMLGLTALVGMLLSINLYTNTHGGGMHNKIFEIMINGGFVALPISSRNNMLGGIEECFIDGEHFSSFNPHKFDEFIDNWLNNSEKRLLIGNNARKEVLDKHTWRSRINKLLNDLSH